MWLARESNCGVLQLQNHMTFSVSYVKIRRALAECKWPAKPFLYHETFIWLQDTFISIDTVVNKVNTRCSILQTFQTKSGMLSLNAITFPGGLDWLIDRFFPIPDRKFLCSNTKHRADNMQYNIYTLIEQYKRYNIQYRFCGNIWGYMKLWKELLDSTMKDISMYIIGNKQTWYFLKT